MHCIQCGHPVGENEEKCAGCGAQLSLLDKWRGQHVRKKDLLSADTFPAAAAAVLIIAAAFLPLCTFTGVEEETWALSRGVAGTGAWFPALDLAFTAIFLSAWFLGEKSRHYFRAAASGAAGCWLLCIVFTFFMAARSYGECPTLRAGYILWLSGLVLQAAAVILYGRRTKILNERRQ